MTEIKLAKKLIEASSDTRAERRKRKRNLREHCWLVVKNDLFLKSSAASASITANTASTNVSDTAESAHQGERQDSKEYEQDFLGIGVVH